MTERLRIVILGLSITSSWGNGHATTYRGLVRELERRGHDVLFLERDVPYYARERDLPDPPFGTTRLYKDRDELASTHAAAVRDADLVIVGSFVPEGVAVGEWALRTARGPVAFYDIDTPVTLAKLARGDHEYLAPHLIPRYDGYFSFTGGPILERLEAAYGSPFARPLYCSVDPAHYHEEDADVRWDLGYLGTYSADRQPKVDRLLLTPARRLPDARFAVAGSMYPTSVRWPRNVKHMDHLPPGEHRGFYNAQRFTLNVTRSDMVDAGWSPSVRLFEAAACGVPIVSDYWDGLETFFRIGREILVAASPEDVVRYLTRMTDDERRRVGDAARARVLDAHTSADRARELEAYAFTLLDGRAGKAGPEVPSA